MSGAQMALNRRVSEMLNRGSLSLEEQAALSRMAAEQEAVRKALENLLNSGGDQKVAGRLDRLIDEMESVIRDLEGNRASEATVRRQQRILSRLLDAQNSLRTRDVSRQRKAAAGQDRAVSSPAPIPSLTPHWQEQIQRDILHLAKEGYTKAYQTLIRQYFEALMRQDNQ
jgi:hypothetical protein